MRQIRLYQLLLFVLGASLLYESLPSYQRENSLSGALGAVTTGTVRQISVKKRVGKLPSYEIRYDFQANDRPLSGHGKFSGHELDGLDSGDAIAIRYAVENPTVNRPDVMHYSRGGLLAGLVVGVLLMLGGVGMPFILPVVGRWVKVERPKPPKPEKGKRVSIPSGVSLSQTATTLTLERRWFCWRMLIPAAGGLLFAGLLGDFYAGRKLCSPGDADYYGLLSFLFGAAMLYYACAVLLNKTQMHVDRGLIRIRHHPLPWLGDREIKTADLTQIYVKETLNKRGRGGGLALDGQYNLVKTGKYELLAFGKSGRDVTILDGIYSKEQAHFLEQELERFLKIENNKVHGEEDPSLPG